MLWSLIGLFHKAILQSGVLRNPWAFTERQSHSTNKGFRLAEKLGKATADSKVAYEFLKTIDAKKLIETEQKSLSTEAVIIWTFDYNYTSAKNYAIRRLYCANKILPLIMCSSQERKRYGIIFTPTLDHESSNPFFPEDPETFMCRGVKVPLLLGFTSCEGSIFTHSSNNKGREFCFCSSLSTFLVASNFS